MVVFLLSTAFFQIEWNYSPEIIKNVSGTSHGNVEITFIDNDFFVLNDGTKVIYFDVHEQPDLQLPDPDLILITHSHGDHFNENIVSSIATSTGATVAGPQSVTNALNGKVSPSQLVTLNPALHERMSQNIRGIDVMAYQGTHDCNSYRLEMGSDVAIYHSGDNNEGDFQQFVDNGYTELLHLNISFLGDWAHNMNDFNSKYDPDIIVGMHLPSTCEVHHYECSDTTTYQSGETFTYIPAGNNLDDISSDDVNLNDSSSNDSNLPLTHIPHPFFIKIAIFENHYSLA